MRLVELIALRLFLIVQLDPLQIYQSAPLPDLESQSAVQLVVFFLVLAQMLVVLAVVPVENLEILTQRQFLLVVVIRYDLSLLLEQLLLNRQMHQPLLVEILHHAFVAHPVLRSKLVVLR